jgi:S1-C subfamily serine protease
VSPAAIRQQVNALGRDIYDLAITRRTVYVLASELAPGDSGAALVNADGEVVGVAFAISPDRPETAYALAVSELRSVLEAERELPAPTGLCIG